MITRFHRTGNWLLDRLPRDEHHRLALVGEAVPLRLRQSLYEPGGPISHIYFPRGGVVSLIVGTADGREVEASSVGREGMLGLSAVLGMGLSLGRAVSQMRGECWRFPTAPFLSALERSPVLTGLLRRYTAFALHCANQLIACNTLHPLEDRLSRWLLTTSDRVSSDNFSLTQEFLAQLLGVRRQTVTVTAGTLQTAGLISYHRGVIRLLDRPRLQEAACECYATMQRLYDRALG